MDYAEGAMFVNVVEDINGRPFKVFIHIGKSGAALYAWADGMAEMVSNSLQSNIPITTIARQLLGISSDKVIKRPDGLTISSGPEALAYALLTYAAEKTAELQRALGTDEDDEYGWLDDTGTFPRE